MIAIRPRDALPLLLALAVSTAAAEVRAETVREIVAREVADACGGAPGKLARDGLIARDLDGDGREDLIVSHEWITCAEGGGMGGRSLFCGMQVCSVNIYVARGSGLVPEREMLGGGVRVGPGARPEITMYAHGGSEGSFRLDPAP